MLQVWTQNFKDITDKEVAHVSKEEKFYIRLFILGRITETELRRLTGKGL